MTSILGEHPNIYIGIMWKYIERRCLELMPETIKKYPPEPCQNSPNDAALVLMGIPQKTPKNWWFLKMFLLLIRVYVQVLSLVFRGSFYPELCGVDALG